MGLSSLEKAEKDRDAAEATLAWLEGKIKGHLTKPLSVVEVDHYLSEINNVKTEVIEIHRKIVACSPADIAPYNKTYFDILDKISKNQCSLKSLRAMVPIPSTSASKSGPANADIRLPKLDLPSFDGNVSDWLSFRDMFIASIGNNTSLPDVQKLTYLKSALTGEAARQIRSVILSDANYKLAWQLLEDRYHNKRELLFSVLRRFTGQQHIQSVSAVALRSLIDTSKECQRYLETLSQPVDQWDALLLFHIYQKIDNTSKELWEQTLSGGDIPKLKDFMDFLEQRARALAAGHFKKPTFSAKPDGGVGARHHAHMAHTTTTCKHCSGDHFIHKCHKFLNRSTEERIAFIKQHNLCYNCLRSGHGVTTCTSKGTCRYCQQKHHSTLHREEPRKDNAQPSTSAASSATPKVVNNHFCNDENSIAGSILATAVIKVRDCTGQYQTCRVLLDGGSTASFISEAAVQRLGLKRKYADVEVVGLGSTAVGSTKGATPITFSPHFDSSEVYVVNALILKKVTGELPGFECDPTMWPHLSGLLLADPTFHQSAGVDILLGADLFYSIIQSGQRQGPPNTPVALQTSLGWLVAGKVSQTACRVSTHYADIDLMALMERFWNLESLPDSHHVTEEEQRCEDHFEQTVTRLTTGRYVVQLPFKTPKSALGESRDIAVRRLKSIERRLASQSEYKSQYVDFMREYAALGHMRKLKNEEIYLKPSCYIPHHYVLKPSSSTTKLRIVFDASSKTSSGVSLNDTLMAGPVIQDTLLNILMRFRTHVVAFCADIAKMYRQVQVHESDYSMQRILWREQPTDLIEDYELVTVTYGTASAPFLATRVLKQLALDEKDKFPLASKVVQNDFYVDDCMSGAKTTQAALELQKELLQLTQRGQLSLRKWVSNSPELLESLPSELREIQSLHSITEDSLIKALGVMWNPKSDEFVFKVNVPPSSETKITKRSVLSELAKLFDPLGWLAPIIISGKILMQELWKTKTHWDDELPLDLQQQWKSFEDQLPNIEKIRIPRCVVAPSIKELHLIGFSDASIRAFSAVSYVRVITDDGGSKVHLISSKTRVAPVQTVTLPRLELCGAVLLAELLLTVQTALKLEFDSITAWTDSTITLAWIRGHPSRWKPFVQNRVSKIQSLLPAKHWHHIAGVDNPADCATRGITATELVNHHLWWTGSSWMQGSSFPLNVDIPDTDMEERKQVVSNHVQLEETILPFTNYSSIRKLKRVTAWINRFIFNLKQKGDHANFRSGELTSEEITTAFLVIIRRVQQQSFRNEYQQLQSKSPLHSRSKILSLNPFMDDNTCIRVGGRLRNAKLDHDKKHPLILPRHHAVTTLIIRNAHFQNCHAGPQALLAIIHQQFWIVNARDAVRLQVKKCVVCSRYAAQMQKQFMGNLPEARVTPSRAFSTCGVDFAGPLTIRPMVRSKVTIKVYLSIFVCFSTRAIHAEVVSSLSADAFIACLRRFISRRGKPAHIYSDNGTNFVGASRELLEMLDATTSNGKRIQSTAADEGIHWHFSPAGGPHFGGIYEAGVKSIKHHLFRVIGAHRLTYEELLTVVNQIEGVLNSRPLSPMSTDPNDLQVLTPGHFLIGTPLTAPPEHDLLSTPTNRLGRWQLLQQMHQSFWKRWSNEFITRLQQRPKWLQPQRNMQPNDMVLIKDDRLAPLHWKLGRVVVCHPGNDGITRVVTVRTAAGELKRPIVKLCLLPIDVPNEDKDVVGT